MNAVNGERRRIVQMRHLPLRCAAGVSLGSGGDAMALRNLTGWYAYSCRQSCGKNIHRIAGLAAICHSKAAHKPRRPTAMAHSGSWPPWRASTCCRSVLE